MENLILRKSDAVLDNNTFRYENDTLDDARRIVMKRITVYSTKFKKHITVSSEALRESQIRYGNQKLSKNVIRYLQPETIDSVEVITSAAVSGVTREQILALSPVFFSGHVCHCMIHTLLFRNQRVLTYLTTAKTFKVIISNEQYVVELCLRFLSSFHYL